MSVADEIGAKQSLSILSFVCELVHTSIRIILSFSVLCSSKYSQRQAGRSSNLYTSSDRYSAIGEGRVQVHALEYEQKGIAAKDRVRIKVVSVPLPLSYNTPDTPMQSSP
jgi:hypothetical protein